MFTMSRWDRNNAIAAFIVAFFYLMCYASACQYSWCPEAAMVDDAYWNHPSVCSGGAYPGGSLNLRWPDAPFNNDTVELQSVQLSVSARSQGSKGTYMVIQVWNGRSWSYVSGGQVDFLGEYKYDLTYMFGPYTDGSARIKVFNSGHEELVIEQLRLDIEYESRLRGLTVVVRDCQTKERLEGVDVEVDDKIRQTYYNGEATFVLTKDEYYHITVGDDDDYRKGYAGVYLEDSEEVEVCVYKIEKPAVQVSGLEVDYDVIRFYLDNTGNVEETVQYSVEVNDEIIFSGHVTLEVGDEEMIAGSYYFPPGIHRVRVTAEAGWYTDSDSTTHYVEGETDNYRCSGNSVVRERITEWGSSRWELVEECEESCSQGVCVAYGETPYFDSDGSDWESCQVEITSFNYADNVVAGETATFVVRARNDGDSIRTVQLKLYADGDRQDNEGIGVAPGKTGEAELQFSPDSSGSVDIRVDAVACGHVMDSVSGVITVKPEPITPHIDYEWQDVPESPYPGEGDFYIQPYPEEVTAPPCEAAVFKVTIHSSEDREYSVLVMGFDEDELDYPKSVRVWGSEDIYVFVKAPDDEGSYRARVRVWSGDRVAEADLNIVVSADAALLGGQEASGLTGYAVTYSETSDLVLYALLGIIIVAVFVVLISRFYLSEQEQYDFASLEYEQSVRDASLAQ